jgi:hypothetical protein
VSVSAVFRLLLDVKPEQNQNGAPGRSRRIQKFPENTRAGVAELVDAADSKFDSHVT